MGAEEDTSQVLGNPVCQKLCCVVWPGGSDIPAAREGTLLVEEPWGQEGRVKDRDKITDLNVDELGTPEGPLDGDGLIFGS